MPLPLIPAAILGGSAILGSWGVHDIYNAGCTIYDEKKKYNARREKYQQASAAFDRKFNVVNSQIYALGERRLQALTTLGEAARFLKKAKVRDRDLNFTLDITPEEFEEWEHASAYAADVLGGLVGSVGTGTATAAAAQGMVGSLAAASTGTPIAALKGAAAAKAMLAWFGGGALAAGGGGMALGAVVVNGLIAGPAVLAAGFFAQRKAEKVRTEVASRIAEMDVAEQEMTVQLSIFDATLRRVDELMKATEEADTALQRLLAQADSTSMEDLYAVARAATALGKALDVPVIPEDAHAN